MYLKMKKFDWKTPINFNISWLRILGLWPSGDEIYKFNLYTLWSTFCISIFTFGHTFFQAVNIIFIFDDLEALAATIYVNLSEILIILKAYFTVKNMKILKQLMITLNSDLFQPRNQRQIEMIEPNIKFWKFNNSVLWTMTTGAVFFLTSYPILDNSTKDFKLPFLAWYPFETEISPNYEITYAYQTIGASFCAYTAVAVDTLIAAFHLYIAAQFNILCDNLRNLNDPTKNYSSDVIKKLIHCIHHHREILKFAENFSEFSNWIIFGQFFISATSIGITLFQLTIVVPFSNEFFSIIAFLLSITVEIFIYCWFGNEVEVKSSQIPYALFESDWIHFSADVKKYIIFMTERSKKPLKVSPLNLFNLSLDTFMKILRTAWSYFALLNQVNSKE